LLIFDIRGSPRTPWKFIGTGMGTNILPWRRSGTWTGNVLGAGNGEASSDSPPCWHPYLLHIHTHNTTTQNRGIFVSIESFRPKSSLLYTWTWTKGKKGHVVVWVHKLRVLSTLSSQNNCNHFTVYIIWSTLIIFYY
jgi:hypothetical protein